MTPQRIPAQLRARPARQRDTTRDRGAETVEILMWAALGIAVVVGLTTALTGVGQDVIEWVGDQLTGT